MSRSAFFHLGVVCVFVVALSFGSTEQECQLAKLSGNSVSELALRHPEIPESSALANMPADLRPRLVKAGDQLLLMGENWSVQGVHMYRAAGLPESEIANRVTAALDHYLDHGRAKGMSEPVEPPATALLSGPKSDSNFPGKYQLSFYQDTRTRMGRSVAETSKDRAYVRDLRVVFDLAKEIGDAPRAMEAALQMVRAGEYENAVVAAEALRSDSGLKMIGMLSLADFYNPSLERGYLNGNQIYHALEAFKRIQGPGKAEMETLLFDLAKEITSPEMIAKVAATTGKSVEDVKESHYRHALVALRATGKLVAKRPIDSYKVDFLTEVSDSKARGAIREVVDAIYEEGIRVDQEDIITALASIGDRARLNQFAEQALRQRIQSDPNVSRQKYHRALEFYQAAGNREMAKQTVNMELDELPPSEFDISTTLGPAVAALNDPALSQRLDGYIAQKIEYSPSKRDGKRWLRLQDQRENGGSEKQTALIPLDREPLPSGLVIKLDQEAHIVEKLELATQATSLQRQKTSKTADQYFEAGNLWVAYEAYRDAGNREGLLKVGDAYVRQGQAHNSLKPYMAAAHLEGSPEGAKLLK